MLSTWLSLVPGRPDLGAELLHRWSEPHRRYHTPTHLAEALSAAELLGAARAELLALWFHDAIFSGGQDDESASAGFAWWALDADPDTAQVARLIAVTTDHHPLPGDQAAARVSDADLAVLAAPPIRYRDSVDQLRAENPRVDTATWLRLRSDRVKELLERPRIYRSDAAYHLWEAPARRNLAAELQELALSSHNGVG